MSVIKTTVQLQTVEDVDELLTKHPEISVKLTDKAAERLVYHLVQGVKDRLEAIAREMFLSVSSWHTPVGEIYVQKGCQEGPLKLVIDSSIRDLLMRDLNELVVSKFRRVWYEALDPYMEKAVDEAIKGINEKEIVEQARRSVFEAIMKRVTKELENDTCPTEN